MRSNREGVRYVVKLSPKEREPKGATELDEFVGTANASTPDHESALRCGPKTDKPLGPFFLEGAARVNILVGPNNAGKSRFLRAMARSELLEFLPMSAMQEETSKLIELRSAVHKCVDGYESTQPPPNLSVRQLFEDLPGLPSAGAQYLDWTGLLLNFHEIIERIHSIIQRDVQERVKNDGEGADKSHYETFGPIVKQSKRLTAGPPQHKWERMRGGADKNNKSPRTSVFIPPLRSLRNIKELGGTLRRYHDDFHKLSSAAGNGDLEIFDGQMIYDRLRVLILSGREGRDRLSSFEDFLSDNCFAGRPVSVSPRETKAGDNLPSEEFIEVRIGDDLPRRIEELGDGIAQVIILAFPLFFDPKRLFFIEEPETNLHPGLQRALLRLFISKPEARIFMTTHSNHFIDMACEELEECAIFAFKKRGASGMEGETFEVRQVSSEMVETLSHLGARVSSVARVNCSVWVEGVTDRRYLSRFLELYRDSDEFRKSAPRLSHMNEHQHYGYIEYAGANIVHYDFRVGNPGGEKNVHNGIACTASAPQVDATV